MMSSTEILELFQPGTSDFERHERYKLKEEHSDYDNVDALRKNYVDSRFNDAFGEHEGDKVSAEEKKIVIGEKDYTIKEGADKIKLLLAQEFNKINGIIIDQEQYMFREGNIAEEVANFYTRGGTVDMPKKCDLNAQFPTFQRAVENSSFFSDEMFYDSIDPSQTTFLEIFLQDGDLAGFLRSQDS